jgi:23S rRNA (pseudouridine1915-N3)-methyltransferase
VQVTVIAVGKIKEKYLQDGIAEYEKRLRPYVKLQTLELPEEKRPVSCSNSQERAAKEKEGERILASIPSGAFVIALDIKGVAWESRELAESLRQWELSGKNHVVFLIGGDLGLAPEVLARSDLRLSLSRMTFTHQMTRMILLEQVYRAVKINHGEPYHK